MEEMDLDNFIFAEEADIQRSIAEDEVTDYVTFEGEPSETEEASEETLEEGEELEAKAEEQEIESIDLDEPPPKTGNRAQDGIAHTAYKERQRRKEAEARVAKIEQDLAFMRGQIAAGYQLTQQQQTEMQEAEDELAEFDWKDPDRSFNERYEGLRRREIARERQERMQRAEQEWQGTLAASVREAREEYDDYREVEARFAARANSPEGAHLAKLLRKQPDPADWAYKIQKRFESRKVRKHPEVEALERENKELRKELDARSGKGKRSIANARGGGPGRVEEVEPQDEDAFFSDIFKR